MCTVFLVCSVLLYCILLQVLLLFWLNCFYWTPPPPPPPPPPPLHIQDYLCTLEQNILGLVSHLEQASRKGTSTGKIGHWFRAISDSEPLDCVTYLRTAASDLSRTCEAIESHHNDSDDGLLVQNLQSIAQYIITSKVRGIE